MANLRNESRLYKKYTKTKRGPKHERKNFKKRPKRLVNLWNESKLYKRKHQNKNRPNGKIPKRGPKQLYIKNKKLSDPRSNLRPDKLTQL